MAAKSGGSGKSGIKIEETREQRLERKERDKAGYKMCQAARDELPEVPKERVPEFIVAVARESGLEGVEDYEGLKRELGLDGVEEGDAILEALSIVAKGGKWKKVMEKTGLSYSTLSCRCHRNKVYREFFQGVLKMQKGEMGARVMDVLIDHLENGEGTPIYSIKGDYLDTKVTRSPKMVEIAGKMAGVIEDGGGAALVKAGGTGNTYNFVLPAVKSEAEWDKEHPVVEIDEKPKVSTALELVEQTEFDE